MPTEELNEIEREEVNQFPVVMKCKGCERTITLWYNGGELDRSECCGYRYELQHDQINLVIYQR